MMNCSFGSTRADPRHAADVVAAEVEQHQVLGALLGVGEELGLEREVLGRRGAARPGAGDRADRHGAALDAHEDLGAGADHLEAAEVEVEHVGRGVGPPERAVEREGRQVEGLRPALARAPPGRCRRRGCTPWPARPSRGSARGWCWRPAAPGARSPRSRLACGRRAVEVAHRVHHPLGGLGVGGARVEAGVGPGRADDGDLALDAVDDQHHRGAQHERVGQAERVGVDVAAGARPGAPCRSRGSRRGRPPSAAARAAARSGSRRSARAGSRAGRRPRRASRRGRSGRRG